MIDFSIIIPAKNEECNIGRCLESIFSINYSVDQYEVIVVDNGSEDKTTEVAKSFGAQIFIKPKLTISGLRNYGASQAKGKIIAFLDADCTVDKNWLSEASRYLNTSHLSCFGAPPEVPPNATWIPKTWFSIRKKRDQVENVEWLESMNMFIPRRIFNIVNGFNESLITCEDYDLSVRLHPHGRIVSDSRIVAIHHGEAVDINHFFRKEYWRATSNAKRFINHEFTLKELPSLIIPPLYCLLASLFVFWLLLFGFIDAQTVNSGWLILLVIWQLPIVFLSSWKLKYNFDIRIVGRLFILLNVYFLARGLSFIGELFFVIKEKG